MSTLISSVSHRVRDTDYRLFWFGDLGDSPRKARPVAADWFSWSIHQVYIRVAADLAEPQIRFELWDAFPPAVVDEGDLEVEGELVLHSTRGTIDVGYTTMGKDDAVFTLPPGWYHVRLSGYRRQSTARAVDDALDTHFELERKDNPDYYRRIAELRGRELYVAQLWPVTSVQAQFLKHQAEADTEAVQIRLPE